MLAGCHHEEPVVREPVITATAYAVSDPIGPPCPIVEGTTVTVERHAGGILRVRTSERDDLVHVTGADEIAGNDTADVRAVVKPEAPPTLLLHTLAEDCMPREVALAVDWRALGDEGSVVVPVTDQVACFVPGPALRIERRGGDVPAFHVVPLSPRVVLSGSGATFTGDVDVTTAGALDVTARVEPAAAGTCTATAYRIFLGPTELPTATGQTADVPLRRPR